MNNEHVTADHIIRAFEAQKAVAERWKAKYEQERQRFINVEAALYEAVACADADSLIDAEETDARPGDWGWRVVIACASFFAGMLLRGWM